MYQLYQIQYLHHTHQVYPTIAFISELRELLQVAFFNTADWVQSGLKSSCWSQKAATFAFSQKIKSKNISMFTGRP